MFKALLGFVGLFLLLSACTYQQTVCPAYQSAYIYDKDMLRKKFSYFENDSTPKVLAASKSKFLIIEPVSYKKKIRALQTVEKKPVPVVVPDSLKPGYVSPDDAFSMAERNVFDSTAVIRVDTVAAPAQAQDSVYQITKDKEIHVLKYDNTKRKYYVDTLGYNMEQDNYMWYLRHVLVLPDAKLAAMEGSAPKEAPSKTTGKATRKKGGFFKNLFKKKEKRDSTDTFVGTTSATMLEGQEVPKKKKEKKKKEKKPKETNPAPVKKEEEEDDGF
jgi:hypothetical protein